MSEVGQNRQNKVHLVAPEGRHLTKGLDAFDELEPPIELPEGGINLLLENPRFIPPNPDGDWYFEWIGLFSQIDRFQREQFNDCTLESTIRHLVEECREHLENPEDRMEKADVIMLAFRVMNLLCADPENLEATRAKLAINKARKWETYTEGNCRHVEEGQ